MQGEEVGVAFLEGVGAEGQAEGDVVDGVGGGGAGDGGGGDRDVDVWCHDVAAVEIERCNVAIMQVGLGD